MTATRDRHGDQDMALTGVPPQQRPLFGSTRGMPWWGSLLLALGLAVVAAVAEIQFSGQVGRVFEGAGFIGCVAAVCLARGDSLFGPMVQPPLIIGLVGPIAMFLLSGAKGGLRGKLFAIANPLINSFPAMAVTTGVTLAIGIGRIVASRRAAKRMRDLRSRSRKPQPGTRKQAGGAASGRTATRTSQRTGGERKRAAGRDSGGRSHDGGQQRGGGKPRGGAARKNPPPRGDRTNSGDTGRAAKPRPPGDRKPDPDRRRRRRPEEG